MSLRDLRKARARTQAEVARTLRIGQDQVSRIEQRTDMLISTLRKYIASLGGDMHVVIEFSDRPPLRLSDLSDVFADTKPAAKLRRPKRSAA